MTGAVRGFWQSRSRIHWDAPTHHVSGVGAHKDNKYHESAAIRPHVPDFLGVRVLGFEFVGVRILGRPISWASELLDMHFWILCPPALLPGTLPGTFGLAFIVIVFYSTLPGTLPGTFGRPQNQNMHAQQFGHPTIQTPNKSDAQQLMSVNSHAQHRTFIVM